MDAELQAIPGMDQTAFFAVWERLLRAFTQGSLLNDSGPAISCLFQTVVRLRRVLAMVELLQDTRLRG
jgi:hypothetical protein